MTYEITEKELEIVEKFNKKIEKIKKMHNKGDNCPRDNMQKYSDELKKNPNTKVRFAYDNQTGERYLMVWTKEKPSIFLYNNNGGSMAGNPRPLFIFINTYGGYKDEVACYDLQQIMVVVDCDGHTMPIIKAIHKEDISTIDILKKINKNIDRDYNSLLDLDTAIKIQRKINEGFDKNFDNNTLTKFEKNKITVYDAGYDITYTNTTLVIPQKWYYSPENEIFAMIKFLTIFKNESYKAIKEMVRKQLDSKKVSYDTIKEEVLEKYHDFNKDNYDLMESLRSTKKFTTNGIYIPLCIYNAARRLLKRWTRVDANKKEIAKWNEDRLRRDYPSLF